MRLDGVVDGVIDDLKTCQRKFDPATYVFSDTGQPLQCTGDKTDSCLSPGQIDAVKKINEGPRNSLGQTIEAPAGAVSITILTILSSAILMTAVSWLHPASRRARSARRLRLRGILALGLGQIPYLWITPPNPGFDPLSFDWDSDVANLTPESPLVTSRHLLTSTSSRNGRGKIIWYHGSSDPGPSVSFTIEYYNALAKKSGGLRRVQKFSRLYLIPNMGHCGGGPSTDQFDMLTPLVEWVENGIAPDEVIASGTNFTSAPTTRSRPLCPYPEEVRYIGAPGGDLSEASNYKCVTP